MNFYGIHPAAQQRGRVRLGAVLAVAQPSTAHWREVAEQEQEPEVPVPVPVPVRL